MLMEQFQRPGESGRYAFGFITWFLVNDNGQNREDKLDAAS